MPVTGYPKLPNGFAAPRMEYAFLSELQLLNYHNYVNFIKKYPKYSDYYVMQLEAEGNIKWSSTKQWKQWVDPNKDLPAFKVTANATPASAGAEFTATLTAASHTVGKLSPIAQGFFMVDDSTDEEFEIVRVNKTTNDAHTVVLRNTNAASAVGVTTANSFMKYMGKPSTQEGSYQRDGIYHGYDTDDYDMTIIREEKRWTDSTKFEVLELDGQSYYNIDKGNLQDNFLLEQELELMINGRVRDNVGDKANGNQNTNHKSVYRQALEKGTDLTATTAFSLVYFEDLARQNDADGFVDEFDVLGDINVMVAWQKFAAAQTAVGVQIYIPNGNLSEIQTVFDYAPSARIYDMKYNFKKYAGWNSAATHGADPSKSVLRGTALFIPKGEMWNPVESGESAITRVRFNAENPTDSPIQTYTGGGLTGPGNGTNAELETALVTHKGIEVGLAYQMKVGRFL